MPRAGVPSQMIRGVAPVLAVLAGVLLAFARPSLAAPGAVDVAAARSQVLEAVNDFRREQGRGTVARNAELDGTAQDFAAFMARSGRFGHEADGHSPEQRVDAHGYRYCIVSENIGYAQRRPEFSTDALAQRLFQGWRDSPPHRHNMLDPDVVETGIGLARSEANGRWYGVQLFGRPQSDELVFKVANQAGRALRYRVGDRTFDLPPRVTRTHTQCRPASIALLGPGHEPVAHATPSAGQRYAVVQDASGSLRLEQQ